MPRACRTYFPGSVWHITHRCHDREFLLQRRQNRQLWLWWLFEARKRHDISILNYVVTSNHIHLILFDTGKPHAISRAMQLVAGQVGGNYNRKKGRHGGFWDGRYEGTAVETGQHLQNCMRYVDMNMVRAGVVSHPENWPYGGYFEIQHPRQRYRLIDYEQVMALYGLNSPEALQKYAIDQMAQALRQGGPISTRDPKWTEAVAVGSLPFVEQAKKILGLKTKGRKIDETDGEYVLREVPAQPYS